MINLKLSATLSVTLYDSIREMPARLYQLARQYEVMASELGQNKNELDSMLARAENYAIAGQKDEFREQLRNYRLARMLVKDGFQANQLDWACHVVSVNGKPVTDYSEDGLVAQIESWSALGLTQEIIEATLDDVKKKHQSELTRFFPKRFGKSRELNQLEQMKSYLLAKINHLVSPDENTEGILQKAFGLVVGQHKPACFREGEQHVLTQMEKGYGKLLVTLAECGCSHPEALSVFQFYTWLETLDEKFEEQKRALTNPNRAAKRQ